SSSRAWRSSRSSPRGRPGTSTTSSSTAPSRCTSTRRTTTRPSGRSRKRRRSPMGLPSGDTPQKAHVYYQYLLSHHESEHRVETWHVDWTALAWEWGFVGALCLALILW